MITISNCPVTGLQRKAEYDFKWFKSTKQIIISCVISHYKDGGKVTSKGVVDFGKELVATNDTMVNPANGQIVLADEEGNYPEGSMGEYDYYAFVVGTMSIVLPTVIEGIILVRDSEGKFN